MCNDSSVVRLINFKIVRFFYNILVLWNLIYICVSIKEEVNNR